jgi:hypothetical protein
MTHSILAEAKKKFFLNSQPGARLTESLIRYCNRLRKLAGAKLLAKKLFIGREKMAARKQQIGDCDVKFFNQFYLNLSFFITPDLVH